MPTIYVIRHAEKPDGTNQGVTVAGVGDTESLIVQGWRRAGALAVFFGSKCGLGAPDRIYAAAPGKEKIAPGDKIGSKSSRPLETIASLAAKLRLKPNLTYTKGQEAGLVGEIVKLEGTTLICWQHEAIVQIATTILGSGEGVPNAWPGARFDVVWTFAWDAVEGAWTFAQVCQNLLAGDSSKPIPLVVPVENSPAEEED